MPTREVQKTCPDCGGLGTAMMPDKINQGKCPACRGTGSVLVKEVVNSAQGSKKSGGCALAVAAALVTSCLTWLALGSMVGG